MYTYNARVLRVVTADTIWLSVDLGCDVTQRMTIELYGVTVPDPASSPGRDAVDWLRDRLPVGMAVTVATIKDHREKHGRYFGTLAVTDRDGITVINEELVTAGHAVSRFVTR